MGAARFAEQAGGSRSGGALIFNISQSGEAYVINEINEHFAPELNGRFVRLTRGDGSLLYVSGIAKDASFDPSHLPALPSAVTQEFSRQEHLPAGVELMIYALPFTTGDGKRFLIEAGRPDDQIESVLHGLLLAFAIGLPLTVAVAIGGGYGLMRRRAQTSGRDHAQRRAYHFTQPWRALAARAHGR